MAEAVIVAAARSPIGRAFKGSMTELRADDLTATIVGAAMAQVPQVTPDMVDDLHLGTGQPAGEQGFNMARVVTTLLGWNVPGVTLNRYCSSSLQTTRMAMHAIVAGEAEVIVSAGVEMVSRFGSGTADGLPNTRNPRFDESRAVSAQRAEQGADGWMPAHLEGRLPDIYVAMGQTAENVALHRDVSRQAMDEFAARSQQRYEQAFHDGFWAREITSIGLPDGTTLDRDDSPRSGTTVEALGGLDPVFRPDGRVTAGNACPLNDGAAAVVVMSDRRAAQLDIEPLARVVSTGVSALDPEIMGLGPVDASRQALARAGMTIDDMDVVELNEAFAAQVLPCARDLGIDEDRLNPFGGAIAVGHPFGMTGARITGTLLNGLRTVDGTFGLETMCVGGGQGMAMVLERLQ